MKNIIMCFLLITTVLIGCKKSIEVPSLLDNSVKSVQDFDKIFEEHTGLFSRLKPNVFNKISKSTYNTLRENLVFDEKNVWHGFAKNGNLYKELNDDELVQFFTVLNGSSAKIKIIKDPNKTFECPCNKNVTPNTPKPCEWAIIVDHYYHLQLHYCVYQYDATCRICF